MKFMVGILVVVVVAVALVKTGDDKQPTPTPVAATEPEPEPEASASFEIDTAKSSCQALPLEARIIFHIAIRNTGDTGGEVNVLPIRWYSDGGTNRSALDTLTATIPAAAERTVSGEFDYNALDHDLIECGARIVPGGDDVPIAVA